MASVKQGMWRRNIVQSRVDESGIKRKSPLPPESLCWELGVA